MINPDKKDIKKDIPVDKDLEKKLAEAKIEADKKEKEDKEKEDKGYNSSSGGVQGDGSAGLSGTSAI